MLRSIRNLAATIAVSFAFATGASAATVNWSGPGNFNAAAIMFTGFNADQLDSYSGQGWFHGHGANQTMFLDVRLNGAWTQIFSASSTDNIKTANNSLDTLISNVGFAGGFVDGIRLRSQLSVNQSFHGFGPRDIFTFSVSTVPLPAALPLLAGVLGLFGFFAMRRRRGFA